LPNSKSSAALLALSAFLVLLIAGCGGAGSSSGGSTSGGSPSTSTSVGNGSETTPSIPLEPAFLNWPFFGRVPQRTHYLPTSQGSVDRPLDPPLKEAWSVDTHGLIEFPPAIADGVAYVINKFGNGKAIDLGTRKILWELQLDPKNHGAQKDVTAPVYYRGKVYGAFLDGYVAAGDAKEGKEVWRRDLHTHLESSPLPIDGKSEPQLRRRENLRRRLRERHARPRRQHRRGGLAHQHEQGGAVWLGRLLLLARDRLRQRLRRP
jgi:hypothetical protein